MKGGARPSFDPNDFFALMVIGGIFTSRKSKLRK